MRRRVSQVSVILAGIWCLGAAASVAQSGPVLVSATGVEVMIDRGDGRGPQPLTGGWDPSLSPDQGRVAFVRYEGILTIGVNGEDLQTVLGTQAFADLVGVPDCRPSTPVWTPDGRDLLFNWVGGFDCRLATVGVDGSDPVLLERPGAIARGCWPSAVSPDGACLLTTGSEDNMGLDVLSLASGTVHRLTWRSNTGSWSPGGTWVAYSWNNVWGYRDEILGLSVVSADGAVTHDLADPVRAMMFQPFEPRGLVTWSPDGKEIAVRNTADDLLYAVAVDGSGVRQVAWHFAPFADPAAAVESASWGAAKRRIRP